MRDIHIIGVPSDFGQGRRGVDMGPSAIRYAGLQKQLEQLGHHVRDLGNVDVPTPEVRQVTNGKLKHLDEVAKVSESVYEMVHNSLNENAVPVILGGDHSIAIGSLAGVAAAKVPFGVIWFDAHGDMNTDETSPSGNIHGMPLAASLGVGDERLTHIGGFAPKIAPERVALVGIRSIDEDEAKLIERTGVKVFTMTDIDKFGMAQIMEQAIEWTSQGTSGIHLSLDLDALDPLHAPGVGTPVNGGISYREGHLAMELLAVSGKLLSVDVVEVNPVLDHHNRTGSLAVELLESLFHKTVL